MNQAPGARFSKGRKLFGPEKLFVKYEPLILQSCYLAGHQVKKCLTHSKVPCLQKSLFTRYSVNHLAQNRPKKLRGFRETRLVHFKQSGVLSVIIVPRSDTWWLCYWPIDRKKSFQLNLKVRCFFVLVFVLVFVSYFFKQIYALNASWVSQIKPSLPFKLSPKFYCIHNLLTG